MTDTHDHLLEIAIQLGTKTAAGTQLSPTEQVVADIMWLDTMVTPNGFYGWLDATTASRITGTCDALRTVGCPPVAGIVERALEAVGLRLDSMSDTQREAALSDLSDAQLDQLADVDDRFDDALDECIAACGMFVSANESEFPSRRAQE